MVDHGRGNGGGNRYLRGVSGRGDRAMSDTGRATGFTRREAARGEPSHTPEFWPPFHSMSSSEDVQRELKVLANRIRSVGNDFHKMQFCLHELPSVLYKLAATLGKTES